MNILIWCSITVTTKSSPLVFWRAQTAVSAALTTSWAGVIRIVKALKEGDIQTAQKLQTECNKVIDLLIKTGVFRGLKTVLHYMDVVSVPLCRKPFGPVDEKYLPELKALAQQLMQERG